eukprot:1158274-Pelagomonas_calceolata.AAC.60
MLRCYAVYKAANWVHGLEYVLRAAPQASTCCSSFLRLSLRPAERLYAAAHCWAWLSLATFSALRASQPDYGGGGGGHMVFEPR